MVEAALQTHMKLVEAALLCDRLALQLVRLALQLHALNLQQAPPRPRVKTNMPF
jgi:hypothetical protein